MGTGAVGNLGALGVGNWDRGHRRNFLWFKVVEGQGRIELGFPAVGGAAEPGIPNLLGIQDAHVHIGLVGFGRGLAVVDDLFPSAGSGVKLELDVLGHLQFPGNMAIGTWSMGRSLVSWSAWIESL